jgi:hypothetical protein
MAARSELIVSQRALAFDWLKGQLMLDNPMTRT